MITFLSYETAWCMLGQNYKISDTFNFSCKITGYCYRKRHKELTEHYTCQITCDICRDKFQRIVRPLYLLISF